MRKVSKHRPYILERQAFVRDPAQFRIKAFQPACPPKHPAVQCLCPSGGGPRWHLPGGQSFIYAAFRRLVEAIRVYQRQRGGSGGSPRWLRISETPDLPWSRSCMRIPSFLMGVMLLALLLPTPCGAFGQDGIPSVSQRLAGEIARGAM